MAQISSSKDQTISPTGAVPNRRAARGVSAALLANLDGDDDDDSSDEENNGPVSKVKKPAGGIYAQKLKMTKQVIKDNHQKLDSVFDKERVLNSKKPNIKTSPPDSDTSDSEFSAEKKPEPEQVETPTPSPPSPPSPPPPPSMMAAASSRTRRKSKNQVEKQLRELEILAEKTSKNQQGVDTLNVSSSLDDNDEEIFNRITVKVLTKDGVCSFEMNKNESFARIYQELAKKQAVPLDSIVLLLKDCEIKYTDTPSSLNLKIFDIIDCGKARKNVIRERIQIVNNEKDDETGANVPPDSIHVIFQTEEGRKSRIKFLIKKTETFDNVLKKYCEKKELNGFNYLLEFDGDRIDLKSTPVDHDLDGDEIFDVKKGSKSAMQSVAEKKKVYDYDDDVLLI